MIAYLIICVLRSVLLTNYCYKLGKEDGMYIGARFAFDLYKKLPEDAKHMYDKALEELRKECEDRN